MSIAALYALTDIAVISFLSSHPLAWHVAHLNSPVALIAVSMSNCQENSLSVVIDKAAGCKFNRNSRSVEQVQLHAGQGQLIYEGGICHNTQQPISDPRTIVSLVDPATLYLF